MVVNNLKDRKSLRNVRERNLAFPSSFRVELIRKTLVETHVV